MCARQGVFEPISGDGRKQGLDQQERDCKFTCKLLCCKCSFCHRVATKERRKSQLLSQLHRNIICERCFLCRSLELCKSCHKCPNCCYRSTCRGKTTPVLGEMGSPRSSLKVVTAPSGLHPPLPVQITNCQKQLCQPAKTLPPFGGHVSAGEQECSRTGSKPIIPGVLQPAIFGTQNPTTCGDLSWT